MLIENGSVEEYVQKVKDEEVNLEGEGLNIRKTVDVANRLIEEGYAVEEIKITTVKKNDKNVSRIEIVMKK